MLYQYFCMHTEWIHIGIRKSPWILNSDSLESGMDIGIVMQEAWETPVQLNILQERILTYYSQLKDGPPKVIANTKKS